MLDTRSLIGEIRGLLSASQNLIVVERLRGMLRGVEHYDAGSGELGYLLALASARSGSPEVARQIVEQLRASNQLDPHLAAEVESLAGRIEKDRFAATGERSALQAAIASYRHADALHPNAFARINLASLLSLAGEEPQAMALAMRVRADLESKATTYWDCATLGEAALLVSDIAAARKHYADAQRLAGAHPGDLASMRRQLLLLVCTHTEAQSLLDLVPGPRVLAFNGHMIAATAQDVAVGAAIAAAIDSMLPVIGYAQAAYGSDILFCEALLARGQELNIVLPFARDDYLAVSVLPGGPQWQPRFERVLAQATSVTYATSERHMGDNILFAHAANLIQGMVLLRARELATTAGTLAVVDRGQEAGIAVEMTEVAPILGKPAADTSGAPHGGRVIKSLLFADVKGFGQMPEEYSPVFFTAFLGLVPRVFKELGIVPAEVSSRGDGLYAVFDMPEDAARFALRLSEAVGTIDWQSMALPTDTHIRIALHIGPVFTAIDPVMNLLAHFGTHVTRVARIEPIVLPGQVLVSEPFAAVLAADPNSQFHCDFVGTEPLAKGYDVARLYRLRRNPH